jgi:uncharacterized protein YwqG
MTATHEAVERIAREHLPRAVAEKWVGLLRPAARLNHAGAADSIVGQLGGLPMLQEGPAWPEWRDHGPLAFVASIDCAALVSLDLDIALPRDGTLAFFYFDGDYDNGKSQVIFEEPESLEGSRVLYVPVDANATIRSAPVGIKAYPRVDLRVDKVVTYPNFEHASLRDAFRAPGEDFRSFLNHPVNDAGFMEALGELEIGPHHQVGGYAFPIQGPVEYEVALATLGGKVARKDPSLSREERTWRLLAQIDSDDDARMMWGDVGMLYWMMRPSDLMTRSFDAALFTWQCS